MILGIWIALLVAFSVGSFIFATLTASLQDFSRGTLIEWAARRAGRNRSDDDESPVDESHLPSSIAGILDAEEQHAFVAAAARAFCNVGLVIAVHRVTAGWTTSPTAAVIVTFAVSFLLVLTVGVALPLAVSRHAGEAFIGWFAPALGIKRIVLWPVVRMHGALEGAIGRVAGSPPASDREQVEEEIEKEILDIVNEGRDEGVIDEAEHRMIERTIRFQDTTAVEVMTSRPHIVAVQAGAKPEDMLETIEKSGHSRIPVYEDTLDRIVGILYARDLFRFAGKRINGHTSPDGQTQEFVLDDVMRQPLVVPETKRLADLLRDMQLQKIHMAVVLDEYGGTSGIVTIEDILEELVGEIEDEHDHTERPMFFRESPGLAEVDARVEIEELNRLMGLRLPDDDEYETLGGFVISTAGQIPKVGDSFEHAAPDGPTANYEILEAEPQRVIRVRVCLQDQAAAEARDASANASAEDSADASAVAAAPGE